MPALSLSRWAGGVALVYDKTAYALNQGRSDLETPNIRTLIKAGFHFGHRTSRWNPKMEPFIFKRRNLIHIIDLRETLRGLILGRKLAAAVAARGQDVMFVGTKKQAQEAVEHEAARCGMPYVAQRWPGGLLTNYSHHPQRLDRLNELEDMEKSGQIQLYSKKMVSTLRREKRKIMRNLGGVRNMQRVPGLLVVVDPAEEHIALREAQKLRRARRRADRYGRQPGPGGRGGAGQ